MFDIRLANGSSFLVMLGVAVMAVALVAVFYRRAFGALPRRPWWTLLALRVAAILIVVVLLFQPVMSSYARLDRKPALIVLLDASASMDVADDASGVTRFNQARALLDQWWKELGDSFELDPIAFSDATERIGTPQELAALRADGKATSLQRALLAAMRRRPAKEVAAVVLLSDGADNAARNPMDVAGQLGLRVHAVGVGASLRNNAAYHDLRIAGFDCPARMMQDNQTRAVVSVEAQGMNGRVVEVALSEDGREIGRAPLALDDREGVQEVAFTFRPSAKGRHLYRAAIEPQRDEKITLNNERSAAALVVEPGIRVLYVEGTLRAEYGALVDRFLAKDPDLEFCALVQTRPNVFLARSNLADLKLTGIPSDAQTIDRFDVFILGDIDASYLRPPQQELIVARVRAGGGLIMLGGYHSLGPGGYTGTTLGDVLPLKLGGREMGQVVDRFLPTLTPEGVRHPIFAGIEGFFPTRQEPVPRIAGLPPLEGCTRIAGAQPGATVLATYDGADEPMPILAVQPVQKGRTAVFCGDTTRNWQQGARALDMESPFVRFWGQTVRWLAGRGTNAPAAAGVSATTDKAAYQPDEPVRIDAVVRDTEGQGAGDAQVVARINGPGGQHEELPLAPTPGPAGHYGGAFEPAASGQYELSVAATVGGAQVDSERLPIEVGRPSLEFESLDLNESLLREIATAGGGRYVHILAAGRLLDELDRTALVQRQYVERELYWPPGLWTLFVVALSAEWLLRRRYHLK